MIAAVASVSVLALGATTLIAPPAGAQTLSAAGLGSSLCKKAANVGNRVAADTSTFTTNGWLALGNWRVNPRSERWQAEHPRHATYTVVFHSATWLIPQDKADAGPAIKAMVEQARMSPDPGNASSATLNVTGWKEAHVTKRLNTAVCLYSLAESEAQRADMSRVIEQLVAANLDENRYYGPPQRKAHNHGIMADQALRDAGRALDRPDWIDAAQDRVRAQLVETFDSCGMSYEQSSAYLSLHVRLWKSVQRWTDAKLTNQIAAVLAEARHARDLLISPDGELLRIGDGSARTYRPRFPVVNDDMWCPETGWYASTTAKGTKTQQTVVRFGPGIDVHGHDDRGQALWWVGTQEAGVPVLSDRGTYDKKDFARTDYAHSAAAHSTLQWRGSTAQNTTGELKRRGSGNIITLNSNQAAGDWTRVISSSTAKYRLSVTDNVVADSALGQITQRFALDPIWTEQSNRSAKRARFVTETGWRLQVTCSIDGRRIAPKSVAAEHFPNRSTVREAISVDCGTTKAGSRSALTATLQVTPPAK